jgi:hypothetical protein
MAIPSDQVARLHVFEVGREARPMFAAAARVVDSGADLMDRVERIVRQIALRATGLLAQGCAPLRACSTGRLQIR